jgi:hypothetical protein
MNTIASTSALASTFQSLLPKITTVPVYQYYAKNQDGGTKFLYSIQPNVKNGWTYEMISFFAFDKQSPGVVPIYQYHKVYADGSVKYYYSPKGNEGNNWKPDVPLPAFYAYGQEQPFTRPVYQYYADDQDGGKKYFYSTDPNAAKNGWKLDFVTFHVAIAKDLNLDLKINTLTINSQTDTRTVCIGSDQSFSLAIEFTGSGNVFETLAKQQRLFKIEYFGEGFGRAADVSFGAVSGKLVAGKLVYGAPDTRLSLTKAGDALQPGIYRISATLTIPGVASAFIEGSLIEVISGKWDSKA